VETLWRRSGLGVGVQGALGGDQRAVPGDLPEHVDGDTLIGHPGKASVAQTGAHRLAAGIPSPPSNGPTGLPPLGRSLRSRPSAALRADH